VIFQSFWASISSIFHHISPISAVSHVMGHGDIDVEDWLQRASQLRGSARDFLRCAPTAVRGQREVMVERMVGWEDDGGMVDGW
jgi:hypothetical protein